MVLGLAVLFVGSALDVGMVIEVSVGATSTGTNDGLGTVGATCGGRT